MRIVIAEDNAELRRLLAQGLAHVGWSVIEVGSGRELLDTLRDATNIALVVTDIRMPEPDGIAAVRALRQAGNATPILVMTAFGDDNARAQASALHCGWLEKPVGLNTLRRAVVGLLGPPRP